MSHAYKKPPAGCPSYVAAVTKHGDQWLLGMPIKYWPSEQTMDWKEALRMRLMEQGIVPRVDEQVAA